MSNLNYVPSWLDSAMTLLEKLNKCIEKIETIVNTVVTVTKTADDALSLAKTNEADIAINESDITELQGNVTKLNGDVTQLKNDVPTIEEKANTAQTTAEGKQNPLYLHEIYLTGKTATMPKIKFYVITEESTSYKTKLEGDTEFSVTFYPFNATLLSYQGQSISTCLTLQLTEISLDHVKIDGTWNLQNCNGTINFAAYLDVNNQINTITDYPEWYSGTIDAERVLPL